MQSIDFQALMPYLPIALVVFVLGYLVFTGRKLSEPTPPSHPYPFSEPKAPVLVKPEADGDSAIAIPKPEAEAVKAKAALDAAGVLGKERLDTIAAVRRGEITGDEVAEAHKVEKK